MKTHGVAARGIWTGDSSAPWGPSIAIDGDQFARAPCPTAGIQHFPDGWVIPGLIDAHIHLIMGGLSLARLDLSGARSREEFELLVAERESILPPGAWLESFGWNETAWGGSAPDKSWLRKAGDRPAVAWRCDQHVALVNPAALSELDLSSEVPGGRIERDDTGRPTGLLYEQAAWRLLAPRIPQPSLDLRRAACAAACAHLHSVGVTSAGAMEYLEDLESVLEPASRLGTLSLRTLATVLDRDRPLPFLRARALSANDFLSIVGFKSFADGTLGSSTAAVIEPYCDGTGSGSLVEHALAGELEAWMREVLAAGYSPSVHAIGDRALSEVLRAATRCDPARRVRFEHAQTVDPDSLPSFRNRIVSMQPFHKATDAAIATVRLGRHRENRVFRFRDFLRAGACLAFGSDWPISSADPMEGMRAAITGLALDGKVHGTSQNLTAAEAISAYTTGAAKCLGVSDTLGRIAPGFFADFTVLDRDPLSCDWVDDAPQVLATVVGGTVRYDALGSIRTTSCTDHIVKS
ncbi:MAG: hypothetical protein EXS03_05515 [Phycisphaerales bacterium]|nr:hypothetical protein [Phycisphaerales bacterium]